LLTTFVGREATIAELLQTLTDSRTRLLTVTGPGGVGKTRLVLAAAERAASDFPDGVWYVALANVTDPHEVPLAVLRTLGIRQSGVRPLEDDLLTYLRDRRCLVILDNFEQLVDASPFLAAVANDCPEVTMVVTSQSLLRLRSERHFPVPSLSTARGPMGEPSEAVQLFVDRALLVKTDFRLTPENEPVVQAICEELDGLPLAIELAAARIRFLTPLALLDRLRVGDGDSLRLLTGGPRDALERHRSLQETIAWSYNLLDASDRRLFRRLSVFVGGFDVDAAAAVWIDEEGDPLLSVYDGIASLLDKSLLLQRQLPEGDTRFLMLAIVRDFAREELARSGEEAAVRDAFAQYYLGLAEDAEAQLRGPAQNVARQRLTREHANVIAALSWFESQRRSELAYRLAWALFFYWWNRGLGSESREWYERILALDSREAGPLRPWIVYAATVSAAMAADFARAADLVRSGLEAARSLGDLVAEAMLHAMDAYVRLVQEDRKGAIAAGERAVAMLREHASGFWLANGLAEAGLFTSAAGNSAVGIPLVEQALELDLARGDALLAGVRLSDLGVMFHDQGDVDGAVTRYRESIASLHRAGGDWYLASPVSGIAAAVAGSEPAMAAQLLGAASRLRARGGTAGWATEVSRDERAAAEASRKLGEASFGDEIEAGRRLSVDAVVQLAERAADRYCGESTDDAVDSELTDRELEVLRLIVTGMSDREIGDTLFISPRTASKHVGNILSKLGLESRSEASAYAVRHGLG
jgi:non-specific serine/threonine protein kinase